METRANFALIGAFTLAVVLAAFSFVFWFSGSGKTAQYQTYELIVRGSVDGLTPGSAVQFNGLKVGSVTSMEIDPTDPGQVKVLIAVDKKTPVKTNTRARVEQKTFTGVAVVSLVGGTPGAPDIVAAAGRSLPAHHRRTFGNPEPARKCPAPLDQGGRRHGQNRQAARRKFDHADRLAQKYGDFHQDARRQQRADRKFHPRRGGRGPFVEAGRRALRQAARQRRAHGQGARSQDDQEHNRQCRRYLQQPQPFLGRRGCASTNSSP